MNILNLVYSYYKCQICLGKESQLSCLYYNTNIINDSFDFNYYDYELEECLLDLIEKTENCSESEYSKVMNSLIENYTRLSDLIEYMHKVNDLKGKHDKMLEDTYLKYPNFQDCFFPDSRLKDILFDNENHLCIMNLTCVTLYNEFRKNKNISVDHGNITLILKNVKNVRINGELCLENYAANKVYASHIKRVYTDLINLSFFILVGHRCFMLELVCSEIDVQLI